MTGSAHSGWEYNYYHKQGEPVIEIGRTSLTDKIENALWAKYHSFGKIPRKAMSAKVRGHYYMEGVPVYSMFCATGVAYGWYIKKYHQTHYEEKDLGAEIEEYDYDMVVTNAGIREHGSEAHASYKRFGSQYHSE